MFYFINNYLSQNFDKKRTSIQTYANANHNIKNK